MADGLEPDGHRQKVSHEPAVSIRLPGVFATLSGT
jgi:hypothetical protein